MHVIKINKRTFIVEYRDDNNNYHHREMRTTGIASDSYTVNALMNEFESKGYTVYCIWEVLDGYSNAELEEISKRDMLEAMSHTRIMYSDFSKERA